MLVILFISALVLRGGDAASIDFNGFDSTINTCSSSTCTGGFGGIGSGDPCDPNPCGSNQICKKIYFSQDGKNFQCICLNQLEGDNCDIDTNECTTGQADCVPLASCRNLPADQGGFECICQPGYGGAGADGRASGTGCPDIDECALGTDDCVDGACDNTMGGFVCNCSLLGNFQGDGREGEGRSGCQPIDVTDPCNPNPCQNGGACTPDATEPSERRCTCTAGFEGPECLDDINECARGTPCDGNTEECRNTIGSFVCDCKNGFFPNPNINGCQDEDECQDSTSCDDNAICNNRPGTFDCSCRQGFTGDGKTCNDIQECEFNLDDCDDIALCTNTIGSFTCQCPDGYKDAFDGANGRSCKDINECDPDDASDPRQECGINAFCVNLPGGATCHCEEDFEGDPFVECFPTDVDDCKDNPCPRGTCEDIGDGFKCNCPPGFTGEFCDQALCPPGYILSEETNCCYYFSDHKLSFQDQRDRCSAKYPGSDLAKITTRTLLNELAGKFNTKSQSCPDFWIGLQDDSSASDKQFIWRDGSRLDNHDSAWGNNQPNGNEGDCVAIKLDYYQKYLLADKGCHHLLNFVCEAEAVNGYCPSSYKKNSHNGRCYYYNLYEHAREFSWAQKRCMDLGGNLAKVDVGIINWLVDQYNLDGSNYYHDDDDDCDDDDDDDDDDDCGTGSQFPTVWVGAMEDAREFVWVQDNDDIPGSQDDDDVYSHLPPDRGPLWATHAPNDDRGDCVRARPDNNGYYVFDDRDCSTTYNGMCQFCLGPIDVIKPCEPNPCQNGGACTPTGGVTYKCACPDGFSGPNCENGDPVCPSGFRLYVDEYGNNGNCYKYSDSYKEQPQAQAKCEYYNSGSYLAKVDTQHLKSWVIREFGLSHVQKDFWVGLKETGSHVGDDWRWESDNSQFSKDSPIWYPGEPNDSGICARLKYNSHSYQFELADYYCDTCLPFICEKPDTGSGCNHVRNGKCYWRPDKSVEYEWAQKKCEYGGGDLAKVDSQDLINWLRHELNLDKKCEFWVGLKDRSGRKYTWKDGSEYGYYGDNRGDLWKSGVPDGGRGECVRMDYSSKRDDFYLNDRDCHITYHFLCEVAPS